MNDRQPRRRDDLPPLERAVSDALDQLNHQMHGIVSSWAHPAEFLDLLREQGYAVVTTGGALNAFRAAIGQSTATDDTGLALRVASVEIIVRVDGRDITLSMRDTEKVSVDLQHGGLDPTGLGLASYMFSTPSWVEKFVLTVERPHDVRETWDPQPADDPAAVIRGA